MFKRNAMGNTRAKILAGAVLMTLGLTAAGAAMSTNVGGGGATLPAGGYVGWNFTAAGATSAIFSSSVTGKPGAAIDSTSLIGNWAGTANKISYCQTGSGAGKKIFDNSDGTVTYGGAGNACTGAASATSGFGADVSIVNPHFAGSDAPMSQSEFNWFGNGTNLGNKATTYAQPVQFPTIVGAIAVAFNNPDVASLNLSDAGVCHVFTGQVADWNQLVAADFTAGSVPTLPLPSRALHLAYRSDGSGTTFSLANHLSTVCGTIGGHIFQTDQAFTTVVSQFGTLPPSTATNFSLPASGNPAVVQAISNNAGAIGYAEAANLQHATVSANTHVAKVNGKDPYADLSATVTFTSTLVDNVIVGTNANGTPHVQAMSPAAPVPGCVLSVNPTAYASGFGYPIVAVSNLIFNEKGNGSDTATVRDLLSYIYSPSRRAGATLVGAGTGYAFVTAPTANAKINTCINS